MIDLTQSVPNAVIVQAQNLANELRAKYPIPRGLIKREYYHWSVAPHGDEFPDYNVMALLKDGMYELVVTHDPRDNAPGLNDNVEAAHTWHRNTGAIGISIDGMDGATVNDFGSDALNEHALWALCAAGAAVAIAYGVDASGVVPIPGETHVDNNGNNRNTSGEPNVATHAEAAIWDFYPSERWDLGCFEALPEGTALTPAMRTASGNALRALTHRIKLQLK